MVVPSPALSFAFDATGGRELVIQVSGEVFLQNIQVAESIDGDGATKKISKTKKVLFHKGPFKEATNNIGEFLALVHGLAFLKQQRRSCDIYSDSRTAIKWVSKKKCNTSLKLTKNNQNVFELISKAEKWLKKNTFKANFLMKT